jgi:hypothetical protein
MMQKILLTAAVAALIIGAMPIQAGHEAPEINYIAGIGDYGADCTVLEETGFCLGGAIFADLSGGNYAIDVADENGVLSFTSGAYRIEPGGSTVDTCFPATATAVPAGGTIAVFIDGVVFWALGQPCGTGELSQGTTGTITVRHL